MNPLPESSFFPSSFLLVWRAKKPVLETLCNRRALVKHLKFSNLISRTKLMNPAFSYTAEVLQGGGSRRLTPICYALDKPMTLAPSLSAGYNSLVLPVSQTIRVTVLFFGRLKDLTGYAEDSRELADGATIEQLFAIYTARYPELAKYRSSVVASRNQEFAAWDTALRSGAEVAFLPPVSGG